MRASSIAQASRAAPGRRSDRAAPAASGAASRSRPDRVSCSRRAGARDPVRAAGPGRTVGGRSSAADARARRGRRARCAPSRPRRSHRPCCHCPIARASSPGSRPRRTKTRNSRRHTCTWTMALASTPVVARKMTPPAAAESKTPSMTTQRRGQQSLGRNGCPRNGNCSEGDHRHTVRAIDGRPATIVSCASTGPTPAGFVVGVAPAPVRSVHNVQC